MDSKIAVPDVPRPQIDEEHDSQNLEEDIVRSLAALAHSHRLNIFRLLIQHAPHGLPAGKIAKHVGLAPSNLSFHIAQLEAANMVKSARRGRIINYSVNLAPVQNLLEFFVHDCCNGLPEIRDFVSGLS